MTATALQTKSTRRETAQAVRQSLPPSIVRSMRSQVTTDCEVIGYEIDADVPAYDLIAGIALIDEVSQPMAPQEMKRAITKLLMMTKRRADDQIDLTLIISAYAEELAKHPADIVAEVLDQWPRQSKWWPAWHELEMEIGWRNKRSKMRDALQRRLDNG